MISITDGKRIRLSKKLLSATDVEIMESKEKNAQEASTSAFQRGTGIDPVPGNILMQILETIPRLFLFSREMSEVLTGRKTRSD